MAKVEVLSVTGEYTVLTIGAGALNRIEQAIRIVQDDGDIAAVRINGIQYTVDEGLRLLRDHQRNLYPVP